jgi:Xanthine dehydrogenase, molybdopterin-binding subunit B
MNFYKEGDETHYNQPLEHCTIQRCWDECLGSADYVNRKKQVEEFNRYGHTLHKKDIYVCVCVWGGIQFWMYFGHSLLVADCVTEYKENTFLLVCS